MPEQDQTALRIESHTSRCRIDVASSARGHITPGIDIVSFPVAHPQSQFQTLCDIGGQTVVAHAFKPGGSLPMPTRGLGSQEHTTGHREKATSCHCVHQFPETSAIPEKRHRERESITVLARVAESNMRLEFSIGLDDLLWKAKVHIHRRPSTEAELFGELGVLGYIFFGSQRELFSHSHVEPFTVFRTPHVHLLEEVHSFDVFYHQGIETLIHRHAHEPFCQAHTMVICTGGRAGRRGTGGTSRTGRTDGTGRTGGSCADCWCFRGCWHGLPTGCAHVKGQERCRCNSSRSAYTRNTVVGGE